MNDLPKPEHTEMFFPEHVISRRQDQCTWYVHARHVFDKEGGRKFLQAFETYESAVLFTMENKP